MNKVVYRVGGWWLSFSWFMLLICNSVTPLVHGWNLPLSGGGRIAYEGGLLRIRTERVENLPNMPDAEASVDPFVLDAIEIRDTKTMKGFGAYAVQELPKHTFLGFYAGIHRTSLDGLENPGYIMTLDGGETYLDGYQRAQDRSTFSPVHLNHADKPDSNCLRILEDQRCAFFTARDIEEDEELTFDYGTNYWRGREQYKI